MNSLYKKGMISAIVLTSLLLLSIPAAHAQEPQILIQPAHTDVGSVSETFSIYVWLDVSLANVTNLYGWQVKIGYNTTILDATDAGITGVPHPHEGLGVSFQKLIEDADGYILVALNAYQLTDVVNVTENKPLCYINFTSTEEGNSTLEFLGIGVTGGTYMLNNLGQKIPFEGVDGDVTVIPEFTLFMSLVFMITTAVALVFLRKRWNSFPT